ncbi:YqjF family protein [Brachybacterium sp. UNK5269]|uniref:YqjF family protein n=1 Tax=Brachybacterium sp. UNK5269 TaxID=3408576 RepID=UPI003BB1DE65
MAADEISAQPPPLGGRAIMRQRWSEVSFLHWRVDPALVAPHMPPGCRPDLVDGSAWVGLIAFQMSNTAFLGGPRIPWLGDFPEVNVRLYSIDALGRRGVVFLSLEASHLLPVLFARAVFGLRYQWAAMSIRGGEDGGALTYRTRRIGRPAARSRITVRPLEPLAGRAGDPEDAIAVALTARWAFHQRHLGRTLFCRNQHQPWPLQRAELVSLDDQLLRVAGFGALADRAPDSVLYASAVDTEFGGPSRVPRGPAQG